jgi:hypothetical protein
MFPNTIALRYHVKANTSIQEKFTPDLGDTTNKRVNATNHNNKKELTEVKSWSHQSQMRGRRQQTKKPNKIHEDITKTKTAVSKPPQNESRGWITKERLQLSS